MGEALGLLTRGKIILGHHRPDTLWTLGTVGDVWGEAQALTAFIISSRSELAYY